MEWRGLACSELEGVTATSSNNAWAVGNCSTAAGVRTLIEHWNGTKWRLVPSPNFNGVNIAGPNYLTSVTATSGSSAWAVGTYMWASPDSFQGLILHWNGKVWARSAVQSVASDSRLYGITSIPDGQAWAVGYCDDGTGTARQWLIWHFSGNVWHLRISPPRSSNYDLSSVGATSPGDVWAMGGIWNSAGSQMLALHF